MSSSRLDEALKVARDFSQFAPSFGPKGPKAGLKRVEHSIGYPFMRRQRIYNNAVVNVLEELARDRVTDRAQPGPSNTECAHHEGIAALRRDLVALQQELAELRTQLPAPATAAPE